MCKIWRERLDQAKSEVGAAQTQQRASFAKFAREAGAAGAGEAGEAGDGSSQSQGRDSQSSQGSTSASSHESFPCSSAAALPATALPPCSRGAAARGARSSRATWAPHSEQPPGSSAATGAAGGIFASAWGSALSEGLDQLLSELREDAADGPAAAQDDDDAAGGGAPLWSRPHAQWQLLGGGGGGGEACCHGDWPGRPVRAVEQQLPECPAKKSPGGARTSASHKANNRQGSPRCSRHAGDPQFFTVEDHLKSIFCCSARPGRV